MTEKIWVPLYLNTAMVQDLSALLLDGYFTTRSERGLTDDYILGRISELNRRQNTDDIRSSPVPYALGRAPSLNNPNSSRGPQLNREINKNLRDVNLTLTYDEAILNYDECFKLIDSRSNSIHEASINHTYTLLLFNNLVISALHNLKLLRGLSPKNIFLKGIYPGDYIEFRGVLKVNTVVNYISNLISILNSYNVTFLDSKFDNSTICPLTYTMILNLLNTIEAQLSNGTMIDIIAKVGEISVALTLNKSYLSTTYLNESNKSPAYIVGKITKVDGKYGEEINLLNKTGLEDYYITLLNSFTPYLEVLNNNGYLVPTSYIKVLPAPALQVIPLCITI